jgi:hypothetical protein
MMTSSYGARCGKSSWKGVICGVEALAPLRWSWRISLTVRVRRILWRKSACEGWALLSASAGVPEMKAILGLFLLLLISACENPKKEARSTEYREQGAVDAASSEVVAAVEGFHLKASTAHNESMNVETIKDELKREQQEQQGTGNEKLDEVRRGQREKRKADLKKELEEATTAKADAEKAYSEQARRIEGAVKTGRALLQADAKPQSLKRLDEAIRSAERYLGEVEQWKKRADDAARQYMETIEPEARLDAQRAYSKIAQEHWDLK